MTESINASLGLWAGLGEKHINTHMLVDQQSIACTQHEEGRMHIKHAFLKGYRVQTKRITPDDDSELHQHHEEGEPTHKPCYSYVERVNPVCQLFHLPLPKRSDACAKMLRAGRSFQ